MNTEEGNHVRVPIPTGELEFPLDHGLYTQALWLTADVGLNFADKWSIQNTAQTMGNYQEWNAIVPFNAMTYSDYIASLKLPAGTPAQLFYTNLLDAHGNKLPFDRSSNSGLGLIAPGGEWHVEKPINAFQDQFTLKKEIGEQKFSLGVYFANYSQTNRWYFSDILTNVADNPNFLDLVTIAGTDTSHVTSNGFRHYLSNYTNGSGTTTIISGVLGGELKLTEQLRADFGVRWESDSYVQSAENTTTIDLDKNPATTFDQENWGNGTFRHFSKTFSDWAGSLGLNYLLTDEISLYAQGSRAYKMPALDEFLQAQAQAEVDLFQARETEFIEGGAKYSTPVYGATLGVFWGQLKNNIAQGQVVDPVTGAQYWQVVINPDSRTFGVEAELSLQPITGLSIIGAGTFLTSKTVEPGGSALTAGGIPPTIGNLAATYSIGPLTLKGDMHYVGKRDIIDATYDPNLKVYTKYNTVGNLPAYTYFNFGASYAFPGQGITLSADLQNAFQSLGLEEGNARLISSGGNPIFLARPILPRRAVIFVTYGF